MDVYLDCAIEGVGGGVEGVGGSPAAVPEVLGAVFVCYEEDGDLRVVLDWVDAYCGGGEVFCCARGEGFLEGAD